MGKKLLSLLLTLLMVITVLPVMSKTVDAATYDSDVSVEDLQEGDILEPNASILTQGFTVTLQSAGSCIKNGETYNQNNGEIRILNQTIVEISSDGAITHLGISLYPYANGKVDSWKVVSVDGNAITLTGYAETPSVVDVTGVTLDPTSASLNVGGTETLTATVLPADATDKTVKWSVNNTNVKLYTDENCTTEVGEDATSTLTVYAKGITVGNSTVTVTSNADSTKTATCEVTVAYPLWVGGVQVTSANAANITGSETPVASYNAETNTLNLNGANISTVLSGRNYGINYEGNNALNIVLAGANTIKKTDSSFTYGIYSKNSAINISGTGSLDVYGFNYGIGAKGDITISSGTVNSIGTDSSGRGICSDGGDIYVEGGAVTARGNSSGIYSKNLTVTGGTLIAEGSAGTIGVGIIARITGFNPGTATISGGNVIAVGGNQAFQGNVINSIKGTGWTDVAGTEGEEDIAINTSGQPLSSYRKVQFPAVAHEHDEIVFTSWTSTNSLPSEAGNYYLENNVTLSEVWTVPEGTTNLCLNGHTIKYNGRKGYANIIDVNSGATLNLYDEEENNGKIQGFECTSPGNLGTVNVNGGSFTMHGGIIQGPGRSYTTGGGVFVGSSGNATISGGTITGYSNGVVTSNSSSDKNSITVTGGNITDNGTGIAFGDGENLTITGGRITGNYNGVRLSNPYANFSISGSPYIYENINYENKNSNLSFVNVTNYEMRINITGELSENTKIGVKSNKYPIIFTNGWNTYMSGKNPTDYFSSDDNNYSVLQEGKELKLGKPHTHEWSYTAEGAVITATCADSDGGHGTPKTATLTINAPALTTYGGSESAEATITGTIDGVETPAVVYKKGDETLSAAPTEPGDYVAEITLGTGDNSATAFIGYTIAKAQLTDVSVTQDGTLTYNKTAQTPAVTTAATAKSGQTVTFTYSMTETGEYGTMPTVTDAGEYTFYYKASAPNHEDVSGSFTVTVNKATAPEVVTPTPEAVTYDPNKTLANVELPEGWSWADNTVVPTVNNEGYQAELSVDDDNYDYSAVEGYDADTHKVIRTVALTVNKADSTAATVEKNDTTYDATEKALVTVTGSATGGKMNYVLGTDAETAPTEGWSEDIPSKTNAGTYYVWYKVAGDENHKDTQAVCVEVKISTVTLTVEAINQNIKVGGTVPDLSNPVLDTHYSVTGLKGEDTLTTNPALTYKKNGETVSPDNSKAGTYDIVISDADAGGNYTIDYRDATLTISNKDPQTIAVDDVTVTYGDTDKKVSAVVKEPATGGGKITYAVKDGSQEYIGIMIDTGELSIINVPEDNKAYVIVTAAETPDYALTTKEVIITINPIDKSKLESAIEAATAYNNSIKDVSDFKKEAEEVKTLIETAQRAIEEGRNQQEINDATTALNNALANNLKKLSDKLPETDKATLDNEETIKAANKALNALTADQKALVDNSVKAKIINDAALVVAIKEGKYFTFKGDNGQWTRGSSSTLPFTIKHTLTDDPGFDLGGNVTYRSFKGIKVDGKSVSEKTDGKLNYTYIPGSVKIDLLPDYLKTLSVGDHTLTVEFAGNMSATAKFKVLKESSSGGNTPYVPPKTGIE